MGNVIAQRDIEKVFPADEYSCVGITGTAGLAVEVVRLFQTELEHYEKIEGMTLSMDGKANRFAALIRPTRYRHAGAWPSCPSSRASTTSTRRARIFILRRDRQPLRGDRVPLGRPGALFARGSLKKLYREDLDAQGCVTAAMQALYDAADDDSATGGPDMARRIFPVVGVISEEGYTRLPDTRGRDRRPRRGLPMLRPDGPAAYPHDLEEAYTHDKAGPMIRSTCRPSSL